MPFTPSGAQRASRPHPLSILSAVLVAAVLAVAGIAVQPSEARAAGIKVVVVVGPVGSKTAEYRAVGSAIASKARSYGATVYRIFSPNATWSRVRQYARGANLFVYIGHGNGWPSPYPPFQTYTKDGLGLNREANAGDRNVKYYGEHYLARYLDLAPNAVVILTRLCYASGNSEGGAPNPTRSVAHQRVDNYGAGFLRTGARAVFAEGIRSTDYILYGLFRTKRTMNQIFWSAPHRTVSYRSAFWSSRTRGKLARLDPYAPGRYYRSVIGDLGMTASTWR